MTAVINSLYFTEERTILLLNQISCLLCNNIETISLRSTCMSTTARRIPQR